MAKPTTVYKPPTGKTVDAYVRQGEIIKPSELIELRQDRVLTLLERRIFNLLFANAFGPDMLEHGRQFEMPYADLRGNHNNNTRVKQAITRLQKTLLYIQFGKHRERAVQLLGGVDTLYDDKGMPTGIKYNLDPTLCEVLQDSEIYARLEIIVLNAFRTKYGMTLYEMLAKRVGLRHVFYEDFTVEELRIYLGVEKDKLKQYGQFKDRALEPGIKEVNDLAPFSCGYEVIERKGRRITKLRLNWWYKTEEEKKAQWLALTSLVDDDEDDDLLSEVS